MSPGPPPPTSTATTRIPATTTRTTRIPTRTRSTPASGAALARCLEPVAAGEFLAEYWERRPLVVARGDPGRFDDLLSEAEVERLICETAIRYPAFRLVKEGAKLDLRDYTRDLSWRPHPFSATADVERVLAEFEAGATIVLQGLHLNRPSVAAFCRALEAALSHPVQANAYYTPRDSQGLAVHHDTHDVFVLQIGGEKRWLVYEPALELPLKDQRYSAALGAPGEPVLETTLRAGDTLYLPRGWLHEALTSSSDSLHLTVGVKIYTWLDAVRAALEECADDVEFRRGVDGSAAGGETLVDRLAERLGPDDVARRRKERMLARPQPVLDGQLTQLRALASLDLGTPLERRATAFVELEEVGDAVVLAFHGKRLQLPDRLREEAEYVAAVEETFTAADLPGGLDEAGRLVLVRRLVREGLLRIAAPGPLGGASPGNGAGG